jgi:hypothetical protein
MTMTGSKVAHLHGNGNGNYHLHTLDGILQEQDCSFNDLEIYLGLLKKEGYRLFVGRGTDHEPPLEGPDQLARQVVNKVGINPALP